ncbi:M48 family metalloprotease [Salinihabitans flavidus]|nr:M48 family metalloprotease [Salinihabitans flavidus]
MVADIMSTVGLVPRFEIFAANVPNAAAVIEGQQRLIVYSESWIQNTADNNRWAAIALLGHEIAHHLNGHTLEAGGSRPPTELEADRFAGFVVGKLGGNLQEAQWLFNRLPRHGSETHPPRSARLEAVAVGWRDATGGSMNTPPAPETSQDSPSPAPSDTLVGDWFVVAGSFPHSSTSEANARLAQLRQSGLNVNLVDTDDYAQFTNGLLSVVVASDSRRRAFEELEKVKRHVPDAYVKKGN